jgi:hypothetical protein
MRTGDDVVFIWALVRREDEKKVGFPKGSLANGINGKIEDFLDEQRCKRAGSMAAAALKRAAEKSCPELKSNLIERP